MCLEIPHLALGNLRKRQTGYRSHYDVANLRLFSYNLYLSEPLFQRRQNVMITPYEL